MSAAIILCAGKGTRMNDDSINKVCFRCAGIPTIKRIIGNMRRGGVDKFVIVVGHQAQSVMDVLADEDGVIYAYQKEQKGTGHAALCGMNALRAMDYNGRVIVSMGDKIIAEEVIRGLLNQPQTYNAVWGVQPVAANYSGGRVVVCGNRPYGVVEFADAALMTVSSLPENQRADKLKALRLNEKKSEKVLKKAKECQCSDTKELCGKTFTAEEILNTPYANAGLYCFDLDSAIDAIGKCNSGNAQGEIYLTDALEIFAEKKQAILYEVRHKEDMLTFSTKSELREMSQCFLRTASEMLADIVAGKTDNLLTDLYGDRVICEKERYQNLLNKFIECYGDQKVIITRSPGRVNLMGRHIDHRGGSINVMTIDRDVVLVAAPRKDDIVKITYLDKSYTDDEFSISGCLNLADHSKWLDYLEAEPVKDALKASKGSTTNYIKSAVLRLQLTTDMDLCGMNLVLDGEIPVAAGLSSSSAIVVATAEAVTALNNLNLTEKQFVEMCGEGEWFVGSRGGAGDHAAMKCSKKSSITHLSFKPFVIGDTIPFSEKYAVIVANSLQQAKKSEGSKDIFNAKVAAYEFALMLIKKRYPQYDLREFRDIAKIDESEIYKILLSLPSKMNRQQIDAELPEYKDSIERIYSSHNDPGDYDVRGVALYGIAEIMRAEKCIDALRTNNYDLLGLLMKISHLGDSVTATMDVESSELKNDADNHVSIYTLPGAYGCSTTRIDELCGILDCCEGVVGSQLVGAGLGGCVIAVVDKENAANVMETIKKDYYDKYLLEHAAQLYLPSSGSSVMY